MALQILALQLDIAWEDKAANVARVRDRLAARRPAPGTLVVLPEMFNTGFSRNPAATAEPEDGPTTGALASLARTHRIAILAGYVRSDHSGVPRNQAVALGPDGQVLGVYTKQKPSWIGPESAVYPAGAAPVCFSWGDTRISPFICYDLRFPEVFREAAARFRPHLYVVIASWVPQRMHHWLRLLQARAIENQACVLGVNRVGLDPDGPSVGESVLLDPEGEIIARLGGEEGELAASVDPAPIDALRTRLPFLADLDPGH